MARIGSAQGILDGHCVRADKFDVSCFSLTCVEDLGDVLPIFSVPRLDDDDPRAFMELGCWLNRHSVALIEIEELTEAATVIEERETSNDETQEWLATILVVFKDSGGGAYASC